MSVTPVRRVLAVAAFAAMSTLATTAVVAPASAAPSPSAPGRSRPAAVQGEAAARLAESWLAQTKGKARAARAVKLTSAPHVLTLGENPTGVGALVVANAGGTAVVRTWFTDERGWSPWAVYGTGIAGAPQVGHETDEVAAVYARSASGRLVRSIGGGFVDQGIATNRDPVTFTNWGNDDFHVYVVGTDGTVRVRRQSAESHTWSAWSNMGGSVTVGTVAPYFNFYNGNVSLFVNNGNQLAERYLDAKSGRWSGWSRFAGKITGTPVPHYNDYNGNTQVYANRDGDIVELYWNSADGRWLGWGDFNGRATGEPAVYQNPLNSNVQVYANSGGKIQETYWSPGRPWSGWHAFPGSTVLAGAPAVTYDRHDNRVRLLATTSAGELAENTWSLGNPWSGWTVIPG